MLSYLAALVLAVLMLLAVLLRKAYSVLTAKELKRRAEAGDVEAANLYRAVAYGPSLRVLLWLVIIFGSAASFVLLGAVAPPVLGFVAILLLIIVAFAWLPNARPHSLELRLAELATPAVAWLTGALDPVLARIYRVTHRRPDGHVHTGIYVRDDLIHLIERQKAQTDNELSIEELTIAENALRFGEKHIRDLVVKRRKVQAVDAQADISPVFLDELHKSGHGRFPVYQDTPDNVVGTLYLRDLTNIGSGKGVRGKVRSHMTPGVTYVHEKDSLADALHAFYLTKRQLFVVTNKFEEYVGIVTLEDILRALLGAPGEYEFDQHETRSAVAARHNPRPKVVDEHIDETVDAESIETAPAEVSQSPQEVVE